MPKSELIGDQHRGKGGYWTIDPTQMEKFKNGAFAKGSSASMRRKPTHHRKSPSPSLPDTPMSTTTTTTTTTNDIKASTTTTTSTVQLPIMQIHNLLN